MAHLWEVNHPFYGAEANVNQCASFAELRATIDALDDHMNFVYRWDWRDWSQPHYDELFRPGAGESPSLVGAPAGPPRLGRVGQPQH